MDIYGSDEFKAINEQRGKKFQIAISILILILVGRLWSLQIFQGKKLRSFSDQNTIKEQKVQAPRGYFLDRNGRILVGSHPGYRLTLDPKIFKSRSREKLKKLIEVVSPIIGQKEELLLKNSIKNYNKTGPFNPAVLVKEISKDQALELKQLRQKHSELIIESVIFRDYPLKESGAQIFGYVSTANKKQIKKMKDKGFLFKLGDQIGQTGLEKSLDKYVRGKDGISYVQVDARGRVQNATNSLIDYIGLKNVPAQIGKNIILTIDRDIQEAAHKAFFREDSLGVRKGGLVALNMSGEVLAWTSNPSFDPSQFQTGISSDSWKRLNNDRFKPLTDKVAQGTYSPGSVFKPLIGLAGLHHKAITKHTMVDSPGMIMFGGRPYHDSRASGHGVLKLENALEVSGNVFFYKLGMELGVDKMSEVISKVGIGKRTGVKFVTESTGLLPTSKWKKETKGVAWQPGESLSYAIGQGFVHTTLLQLARSYLTIATRGKVFQPLLVKEIIDSKGNTVAQFSKNLIEDVTKPESLNIDSKHFDAVIAGLIKVAHGSKGTARYRSSKDFLMAGKTGTVQLKSFSSSEIYKKCENRVEKDRHHGMFVGFAPAENPEIVVAGLAIHGCHGASGAAPMVTDVLTAYMKKYHPEIYKKEDEK